MKTLKLLSIAALFATTLIFSGCTKEGPAGPAGPAGANGNANVQSSTVTVTNWVYSAPSYYTDIYWTVLTTDIVNNGAVLVYVLTGTNTWSQLPVTFYESSSYSSTLEVVTSPNLVRIIRTDSDLLQPNNPGALTFRVVAIAASQRLANPDVDYANYNEVAKRFNLHK